MSQRNVEVVRSVYDAWARDEFPGPADLLDDEIEYVNPTGAVEPGTRHGLAAFGRAVEKVFEGWEIWQMEPEGFATSPLAEGTSGGALPAAASVGESR